MIWRRHPDWRFIYLTVWARVRNKTPKCLFSIEYVKIDFAKFICRIDTKHRRGQMNFAKTKRNGQKSHRLINFRNQPNWSIVQWSTCEKFICISTTRRGHAALGETLFYLGVAVIRFEWRVCCSAHFSLVQMKFICVAVKVSINWIIQFNH